MRGLTTFGNRATSRRIKPGTPPELSEAELSEARRRLVWGDRATNVGAC